jgi:AcrR family transcriptional regulator
MTARAAASAETGRRIVRAMQELFALGPYHEVTLQAVAGRAGVTLQTVLRRFGSKGALLAAAAADARARVAAQREEARPGDHRGAIRNLFDHYEAWADTSLRLLEQEERVAEIATLTREGRALHARWVERVFAPALAAARPSDRPLRRAQLIVATDVYAWKLLRRDLGLARSDAEHAVLGTVDALCRR